MSNHTPGPWQIIMGGLQGDDGFAIGSKVSREVVSERWPCTCDNDDRARMIADSRLISAAPEMLELLRECYPILDYSRSDEERSVRLKIRDLIARIEGE